MSTPRPGARELAARTPADRDRYLDLLRVLSLATVVVGHWLMAAVETGPDGRARAGNALAVLPSLQPLTWVFQVMPLFFAVGGFAHATALRKGPRYGEFVRARAARLLVPTGVFVAVWLVVALAIELAGRDDGMLRLATRTVAQPRWFIGVYLGVMAFAPLMWRLHRAHGPAVPAALAAGAVAVDAVRFGAGAGWEAVGHLNLLLVWLAVHQMGFLYADRRENGGADLTKAGAWLAGTGLTAVLALTAFGPYPVSMVGMPGEKVSNMSPPTLALLAHATWLLGLALLLRRPAARWLGRPRVWLAVITANGLAMTAFLWHLTALFLLSAVQMALGAGSPPIRSAAWWATRPVWIALLAAVTAALILVFRRADAPPRLAPRSHGPARSITGITLCLLGVLGFSAVGFGGVLAGRTAHLIVLPMTPLACLASLAAGAALLSIARVTRPQ
jgi:hypothetical protein